MNTIEKAARLIYDLNPDLQPWDGDAYGYHETINWSGKTHSKTALAQAKALAQSGLLKED